MMIEADVNLGYFTGGGSIFDFIPIMAHPPIMYSDLSLDLFLETIIQVSNLIVFFACQIEVLEFQFLFYFRPKKEIRVYAKVSNWISRDLIF